MAAQYIRPSRHLLLDAAELWTRDHATYHDLLIYADYQQQTLRDETAQERIAAEMQDRQAGTLNQLLGRMRRVVRWLRHTAWPVRRPLRHPAVPVRR